MSERVVGASRERGTVEEWALVLAAADIDHRVEESPSGWLLLVGPGDADAATAALAGYEREDVVAAEPPTLDHGRSWIGVWLAGMLVVLFTLADEQSMRAGRAAAGPILRGEVWRTVTALGLHADLSHLAGNAAAIAVFGSLLGRLLGPGLTVALVLLAGAGGNGLSAALHGPGHAAVGASTAIFGAVGILGGIEFVRRRRMRVRGQAWLAIGGSLALLGMLGTAERADLAAHLFGLLVGLGLGLGTGLVLRAPPRSAVQALLLLAAAAVFGACWNAALR